MATKRVKVQSERITYGFEGADCETFEIAKIAARPKYDELCKEHEGTVLESFEEAIRREECSMWLELTFSKEV